MKFYVTQAEFELSMLIKTILNSLILLSPPPWHYHPPTLTNLKLTANPCLGLISTWIPDMNNDIGLCA